MVAHSKHVIPHNMHWYTNSPSTFLITIIYSCSNGLCTNNSFSLPAAVVPSADFDRSFVKYIKDNGYRGGQVGVMIEDRLAFAKGYGKNHEHKDIYVHNLIPVGSFSKAFTAVTILKLVEDGVLDINAKVFGKDGLLTVIKPWNETTVDPRIYDITVDHLLRHTGGWDYTKSKLMEPLLNSALIANGYNLENISEEMKLPELTTPIDVIRFMMSKPLDFTPGTKSVVSNLGYSILGQIIEMITDFDYDQYVKKHVMIPCGMMYTKIGRPHVFATARDNNEPIMSDVAKVSPEFVGPALGWESNMYDIMRFSRCLDGSGDFKLLSVKSIKSLMAKPSAVPVQHGTSWIGAAFNVNSRGAIWMEGEFFTDDLLFFHRGLLVKNDQKKQSNAAQETPSAYAAFFTGQMFTPLKTSIHDLVKAEKLWSAENMFLDDIADIKTKYGKVEQVVKYKLEEHHLQGYARALSLLRYDIKWISGFSYKKQTYFVVIAEKKEHSLFDKVIITPGLTEATLTQHKLHYEKSGFNLTYLQNYMSHSHRGSVFVAIFRKHSYSNSTIIRYGLQHYTQSYKKLIELYAEQGYIPTSQSLMYNGVDGLVSFILQEDENRKTQKDYRSYEDTPLGRLNKLVTGNAKYKRKLVYLDVANYFGKPKFSAVFVNDRVNSMLFNSKLSVKDMTKIIQREQKYGKLPRIIVAYSDRGSLWYAVFLEK